MSVSLTINTDGGARGNPGPAGIGVHVINSQNEVVFQQASYIGHATNNEAEYKAVLASLEWLQQYVSQQVVSDVVWQLDSMLVVEQLNKRWKIKKDELQVFANAIWQQLHGAPYTYSFIYVPREQNKDADSLVNKAIDAALV